MRRFSNKAVADVFASYPPKLRKCLLAVRELIFDAAAATDGVGALEETLKWGEPAYVTAESGSGSTIRINRHRGADDTYAIYFNCKTTLVDSFRTLFPKTFHFEGNRAIVLAQDEPVPPELENCIEMALTYHLRARATAPRARRSRAITR